MKLLVINGNPSAQNNAFDAFINELISRSDSAGHQVHRFVLRDMKVKPCTGCFACWVKTPGLCSIKDDGIEIARQFIASDHVIIASPLVMGFVSAIAKNAFDRNIPLVHPHLEDVDGEAHHKKRYDKYPTISFLLQKEPFTDDEDIAIVSDIFKRESINVRSTLGFVRFIDSPVQEVLDAINIH
ncbi:MAG: flavodoxin family protein [Chrysiogenales bacterium]|nr:MAG: flavodoxin family protein [Chrysiogenales bacterium]